MGGKGDISYAGGYFYGDVKSPRHFGSNSESEDYTAYGGGVISITASTSAVINGKWLANP